MAETAPSIVVRRLIADAIDLGLVVIVPTIWWHWTEWAQNTDTFGGRWPAGAAYGVMMLIPLTVVWLEAVTACGLGKAIAGLRVRSAGGGEAGLGRLLARSLLKWSPIWLGPLLRIADVLLENSRADDFAGAHLIPLTASLADRLAEQAKVLAWTLELTLRTMSIGVFALLVLAIGEIGVLFGNGRTLIDRISRTTVARRVPPATAQPNP